MSGDCNKSFVNLCIGGRRLLFGSRRLRELFLTTVWRIFAEELLSLKIWRLATFNLFSLLSSITFLRSLTCILVFDLFGQQTAE